MELNNTASLEWDSVMDAVLNTDIRAALPHLDELGVVAFTDGACIKNPGGPAGWSALLWAAADQVDGKVPEGAPCLERYGHIPRSKTTTNNRAEIAAVLAVLSLAPPALPLKIYSDSEYTIKVALGEYQMKANPDLWAVYRQLLKYRKQPPLFEWVRGHAGHIHNERADELAGLGAFNKDEVAYEQWQASQAPEAHNRPRPASPPPADSKPAAQTQAPAAGKALSSGELVALRVQVQRLKALFDSVEAESPRVSAQERKFINDMVKRLQSSSFSPSEKQSGWVKGLAVKHKI